MADRQFELTRPDGTVSSAELKGVQVVPDRETGSVKVRVTLMEVGTRKRFLREAVAPNKKAVAQTVRDLCGGVVVPADPAQPDDHLWSTAADDLPF